MSEPQSSCNHCGQDCDDGTSPCLRCGMVGRDGSTIDPVRCDCVACSLQCQINDGIANAVAVEREACAKICDDWARANYKAFREQALAAERCAAHIRERGTRPGGEGA